MTPADLVLAQARGRLPDQAALDWFAAHGVEPLALAKTWRRAFDFIYLADVVFHHDHFEFEVRRSDEKPVRSVLFMARDEIRDPIDIVAWQPNEGYLAPFLGAAFMLGMEDIEGPQMGEGLPVHRSPLGWLQAYRRGVVILDPKRAAYRLRGAEALLAEDMRHGRELEKLLTIKPEIMVPSKAARKAA